MNRNRRTAILGGEFPIYPVNLMVKLEKEYPMGIKRGSINRISSVNHCGATTLALQLCNVLAGIADTFTIIYDVEQSIQKGRFSTLCENIINSSSVTGENFCISTDDIRFDTFISRTRTACENKINLDLKQLTVILVNNIDFMQSIKNENLNNSEFNDLKNLLFKSNTILIYTGSQYAARDSMGNLIFKEKTNLMMYTDEDIIISPKVPGEVYLKVSNIETVLHKTNEGIFDAEEISKIIV